MPILLELGTDKTEARFTVDAFPFTVGRQPDNKIWIRDARISRYHARIEQESGRFILLDNQSTRHTYVNSQMVDRKELTHGDLVSFGDKAEYLFLMWEDPQLVTEVLGNRRTGALGVTANVAHMFNHQVDSLMDTLRSALAEEGNLKKIRAQVARAVAELNSLYEVGSAVNSELDLDRVLELIITHVIRTTGAERGFIMLQDAESAQLIPKVARNMDASLDEVEKTQFSRSIAHKAMETRQTVVSMDTRVDPFAESKSVVDYNIRSAICAPLIAKAKVLGVLYVDARQNLKEFGQKDTEFFMALAGQSAIAIENAQLIKDLRKTAKQRDRKVLELSALYSISQSLLSSSDLDRVLETILDKSIETIGSERASVMLYADEQNFLTVKVTRGRTAPEVGERIQLERGEGIAGRVAESGVGMIANQGSEDPLFKKVAGREQDIHQLLCVPLHRNKDTIGVINLINKVEDGEFTAEDLQLLTSIASQASVTIENSRLYNLAVYDGLTGVQVRRYFEGWLQKEFDRAKRYGNDLTLIIADVDKFKLVNDTYGHQVGDVVLQEVAKILKATVREADLVARYGGEEFVLGLPETTTDGAEQLAERLRKSVEETAISGGNQTISVTISLGICHMRSSNPATQSDLVRYADRALYIAKRTGRNRVVRH